MASRDPLTDDQGEVERGAVEDRIQSTISPW